MEFGKTNAKDIEVRTVDEIEKRYLAAVSASIAATSKNSKEQTISKLKLAIGIPELEEKDVLFKEEQDVIGRKASIEVRMAVSWTQEACVVLLWQLGLATEEDVLCITKEMDPEKIISSMKLLASKKDRGEYRIRTPEETAEMYDRVFQLHWSVVDMRIKNLIDAENVANDIAMERRRGMEWLVGYCDNWYEADMYT